MAIDFPSNPSDGYEWTDPAGTTWVYSLDKNAWAKVKPDPLDGPYTYPGGVEQTIQARLEQHVSANDFKLVFSASTEPSAATAAANSAATNAALAASPYVTIEPLSNSNAILYVSETIVVGSKTLNGQSAGAFGSQGLTLKPHSSMDKTKPIISVGSSGVLENIELVGNETTPMSSVHEIGLSINALANRVKVKNVRIQFFQKGLHVNRTQNSVFEDCQIKFCPVACLYVEGAENCKFLNCTTDMDPNFTDSITFDSRNILIFNDTSVDSYSRNLTFQYGINERGGQAIDHCVEKRGEGGKGLVFTDIECNGGRKSAIQCDSSYTLTNAKFTLQGNNFAATTADSSADFTNANSDPNGETLFYPNKNIEKTNLSVDVIGANVITGLNGKASFQVIPSHNKNFSIITQDFGRKYDTSGGNIYVVNNGSVDTSLISTEQCIKISGSDGGKGAGFAGFNTSTSPMPSAQQLGGRFFVLELYAESFIGCGGLTVKANIDDASFRTTIANFVPDDPTTGGYFKAIVPCPEIATGGFEITPKYITNTPETANFKLKFFNVQMKAGLPN